MSEFLERIVEKNTEAQPVIHPRMPGWFAPWSVARMPIPAPAHQLGPEVLLDQNVESATPSRASPLKPSAQASTPVGNKLLSPDTKQETISSPLLPADRVRSSDILTDHFSKAKIIQDDGELETEPSLKASILPKHTQGETVENATPSIPDTPFLQPATKPVFQPESQLLPKSDSQFVEAPTAPAEPMATVHREISVSSPPSLPVADHDSQRRLPVSEKVVERMMIKPDTRGGMEQVTAQQFSIPEGRPHRSFEERVVPLDTQSQTFILLPEIALPPVQAPGFEVENAVRESDRPHIEQNTMKERHFSPAQQQPFSLQVSLPSVPVPPAFPKPNAQAKAEPTIHVTIGRIEVRAVPQTVAPAHPQHATAPVMTLDEYLRQRANGGAQ